MADSTRVSAQRSTDHQENGPTHVSISARELIVSCARESFDAETLRDLGNAFLALAKKKDGGVG